MGATVASHMAWFEIMHACGRARGTAGGLGTLSTRASTRDRHVLARVVHGTRSGRGKVVRVAPISTAAGAAPRAHTCTGFEVWEKGADELVFDCVVH